MTRIDPEALDQALEERADWTIRRITEHVKGRDRQWILHLDGGPPAIQVAFDGEDVYIDYGRVGLSEAGDSFRSQQVVIDVINALTDHGAQEIYGFDRDGRFDFLGHHVEHASGSSIGRFSEEHDRELFRIDL
jgi:hypothetical protein